MSGMECAGGCPVGSDAFFRNVFRCTAYHEFRGINFGLTAVIGGKTAEIGFFHPTAFFHNDPTGLIEFALPSLKGKIPAENPIGFPGNAHVSPIGNGKAIRVRGAPSGEKSDLNAAFWGHGAVCLPAICLTAVFGKTASEKIIGFTG